MELSEKIRYYREEKGISKSELSRLIGVSPSYITKLENGNKTNPSMEILLKISNVLNINITQLTDSKENLDIISTLVPNDNYIGNINNNSEEDNFINEMFNIEEVLIQNGFFIEHTKDNKINIMDVNKETILLIDEVDFVHTGKDLLIQIREFNELIIKQWIRKNTSK